MGTQQILMIILSVIVVGAAIAVGIQMFDTQSHNQEVTNAIAEMVYMASQAQAWWRTPVIMGGGGKKAFPSHVSQDDYWAIMRYIDNSFPMPAVRHHLEAANGGEYHFMAGAGFGFPTDTLLITYTRQGFTSGTPQIFIRLSQGSNGITVYPTGRP